MSFSNRQPIRIVGLFSSRLELESLKTSRITCIIWEEPPTDVNSVLAYVEKYVVYSHGLEADEDCDGTLRDNKFQI